MNYRGPVAAVTLRGPDGKGTTYHLTPGAEVELPDGRYARSLQARGLLVPIAPPPAEPAAPAAPSSPAGQTSPAPVLLTPSGPVQLTRSGDDKPGEKASKKAEKKAENEQTEPSR